jgi:hypothetical protein
VVTPPSAGKEFEAWLDEYLPWIIGGVVVLILLAILIALLVSWLKARFRFIFLDNVVYNHAEIKRPWREYSKEAHSLFFFRWLLALATLFYVVVVAAVAVALVLPDIHAEQFTGMSAAAIVFAIFAMLLLAIVAGFIGMLLDDFVTPIMYLRRVRVMEAWRIFRAEMFSGRIGVFVVYALFKIVIGMVVAMIATSVTCVLCCIPSIPYIGTVILLPLYVFLQAYPLHFIEQFGEKWRVFPNEPAAPVAAGYGPPAGAPGTGYYPPPK